MNRLRPGGLFCLGWPMISPAIATEAQKHEGELRHLGGTSLAAPPPLAQNKQSFMK
jgi:hypothetical protein